MYREGLKFELRDREQYISINLIPYNRREEGNSRQNFHGPKAGYHILFIRLHAKRKLQVEFIVQNSQFTSQMNYTNNDVCIMNNHFPKLKEGKTSTTHIPKKLAQVIPFTDVGRPSLTFMRSLTEYDIEQIVYLAIEVYNEQSKKIFL
jgi:hypothetical protein